MNGWIRLHRQLLQWEWYSCVNTTRVFIHLLLTASWRDARWQGIEIPRGSLFASPETLATATGLSRQQVRTVITRLKSTSEITTRSTNRGTLITLCNFDTYNPEGDFSNQPNNQQDNKTLTSDQPAINQRLTTSEEGKEGKKGRKKEDKHVLRFARTESRDEFDAFIREVGLFANDAEWLWNKWEANGWVNGKNKIKDWRATVRAWKVQQYFPSQKTDGRCVPWPTEREDATDEVHEFEKDYMAILLAKVAKEEAELYKDHPDNWTPEEWAARQAIENF
jgi:hypothetical protein